MNLERRAWIISHLLVALLLLVSLRAAYWQLWRGLQLQPVALDPVAAAREYARLRGEPTPEPGVEEAQTGQGSSLAALPQPVIQRTVQMLSTIRRGTIYDRAGNVLAEDQGTVGDYTRRYTDPSLAHVVGYTSALRTGINGLEATYNEELLGFTRPDTEIDRLLHRPIQGSDLVLTIDPYLQRAAAETLAGQPGAIVVLDSHTGAILAMTSAPTFNPNQVNTQGYLASLPSGALINRPTQGLFVPGSTFKTVTLITALDTGLVRPETIFDFGEPRRTAEGRIYYVYEVDGGLVIDPNHPEQRLDLAGAFGRSANAAFAKLGNELDPDVFIEYGQRMGFSDPDYTRRFPLELTVSVPQLANNVDELRTNNLLRASTGYGQGELLTTPLNMAMVVQAVLNEGSIPVPYLVESIRDPQGNVIRERPVRHTERGIMRARTANQVKEIMIHAMETYYSIPGLVNREGLVMGGKTGTAQRGGDLLPHAWFIGFVEKGERSVVIVCMFDEQRSPGALPQPAFARMAQAFADQPVQE